MSDAAKHVRGLPGIHSYQGATVYELIDKHIPKPEFSKTPYGIIYFVLGPMIWDKQGNFPQLDGRPCESACCHRHRSYDTSYKPPSPQCRHHHQHHHHHHYHHHHRHHHPHHYRHHHNHDHHHHHVIFMVVIIIIITITITTTIIIIISTIA